MLNEGNKETENTRIERDSENLEEIEMLYTFDVVLFEHTILESDKYKYSICWFEPEKIFDIIIEEKNSKKLKVFTSCKKLPQKYLKLFKLNKNQEIEGIICTSHSIEYKL